MSQRSLEFGAIDRVILFGGAPLLVELVRRLRARAGLDVRVFTAPRQAREPIDGSGTSLAAALEKLGQAFTVCEDIDREPSLAPLITERTLGLGLGEAWSFSPALLGRFAGRLLDFMGIPHPRYRGGAHYTWMILRDDRAMGTNLQVINAEMVQGEHDSGEMVVSGSYELPPGDRTPLDYFREAAPREAEFVCAFLDRVRANDKFPLVAPDEAKSLFLPRLHTATHGWVDWRWSGIDIARFVRAFDAPYPGARTTLEGRAVVVRGARMLGDEAPFHPFQSGLITRVSANRCFVATTGGHLELTLATEAGDPVESQPGQRLHTPAARLEAALTTRIRYGAGGTQTPVKPISTVDEFRGQRTALRLLTLDDCGPAYVGWLNDPEVKRFLETRFRQQDLASVREFVAAMIADPDSFLFAIIALDDRQHIGNLKIGPINRNHSYADVSYFIGERSRWGKGLATDAINVSVKIAFDKLGLHRVQAGVYEQNVGSARALERAGFRLEGRFAKQLRADDGEWQDHLWYGQVRP